MVIDQSTPRDMPLINILDTESKDDDESNEILFTQINSPTRRDLEEAGPSRIRSPSRKDLEAAGSSQTHKKSNLNANFNSEMHDQIPLWFVDGNQIKLQRLHHQHTLIQSH